MKQSARGLACLMAATVVCSAAAAEAEPAVLTPVEGPVVLTQAEMDEATAGLRVNVSLRLAAVQARLDWIRTLLNRVKSNGGTNGTTVQVVKSSSGSGVNTVRTSSINRSSSYSTNRH